MNQITTFNYLSNTVHVIKIDGQPWFVTKDVCEVLDYRPHPNGGYRNALRLVPEDERRVLEKAHSPGGRVLFEGTASRVSLISESGLYRLIMRSDKPGARKFQDWVTREVLPSIRKTGGYLLNEEARETAHADDRQAMPLPELFAQVLQQQAETSRVLAETQRMLAGLLTAPKEPEVKKDGRLISAREARAEFGLSQSASEIGIRSTEYCQAHGVRYYQRRSDQGVNKYPAWVITELFVSA